MFPFDSRDLFPFSSNLTKKFMLLQYKKTAIPQWIILSIGNSSFFFCVRLRLRGVKRQPKLPHLAACLRPSCRKNSNHCLETPLGENSSIFLFLGKQNNLLARAYPPTPYSEKNKTFFETCRIRHKLFCH